MRLRVHKIRDSDTSYGRTHGDQAAGIGQQAVRVRNFHVNRDAAIRLEFMVIYGMDEQLPTRFEQPKLILLGKLGNEFLPTVKSIERLEGITPLASKPPHRPAL